MSKNLKKNVENFILFKSLYIELFKTSEFYYKELLVIYEDLYEIDST